MRGRSSGGAGLAAVAVALGAPLFAGTQPALAGTQPAIAAPATVPSIHRALLGGGDGRASASYVLDPGTAGPVTVTLAATTAVRGERGHTAFQTLTASGAGALVTGSIPIIRLDDGVAYTFSLTVTTAAGTTTTPLGSITPSRVPHLVLDVSPPTVLPMSGVDTELTGTLTNGDAPVAGRAVVITVRTAKGTTMLRTRTRSDGTFSLTHPTFARTTFVATATFGPRGRQTISQSPAFTVVVSDKPVVLGTTIGKTPTPTRPPVGNQGT